MVYERASVRRTAGYVPGRQVARGDLIKLNTNENPYPPSPAVLAALAGIDGEMLRRYPPPLADRFRGTAARLHGVAESNVVAVNGGDELLRLAVHTFVEPGRPIGVFAPTYSLYGVLAALHGSDCVEVPRQEDWSIPGDAAERWNRAGAQLGFVVNPHAPSGHLSPRQAIAELAAQFRGVLVVDEAYVDFVDPELDHDVVSLVHERDNVLILRTLSKGYSLAGLRFGYGLGHRELVAPMLGKTRDSYNVDAVAQILAQAALEQRADAQRSWAWVRSARAELGRGLVALGFSVWPSQANFLLARAPEAGPGAAALCAALEQHGILVRHFATPRLEDKLRITVGTPQQNARLLEVLGGLPGGASQGLRR
jgi:histidinol-phosphate aminotransferase